MLISLILSAMALADCASLSLDEVSKGARTLLSQGEATLAVQSVQRAIEGLPCQDTLLRAEDLGELYLTGAMVARQAGDEVLASLWVRRAASMVAPAEFYPTLGDLDGERYATARSELAAKRSATITPRSMVYVDGHGLIPSIEQRVVPGDHVLQQVTPEGVVRTSLIVVQPGEQVVLGELSRSSPLPRRVALASTGVVLTLGGGACLVDAGLHRKSLGETEGKAERHADDHPDDPWPGLDPEKVRAGRLSTALTVCGVTGIAIGSTVLGASIMFTNNTITFTKSW